MSDTDKDARIAELESTVAELRKALEYYADKSKWKLEPYKVEGYTRHRLTFKPHSGSSIARRALNKLGAPQ